MKKLIFLTFSFLLFKCTINAQIDVTPVNKYITCCGSQGVLSPENDDIVDLNNDLITDIYFYTDGSPAIWTQGFYCNIATGIPVNNYKVSDLVSKGDTFPSHYGGNHILTESNYDAGYWAQTGGIRYLGVRKITGVDTNYGWLMLEYVNKNAPLDISGDTIKIMEYAINTIANEPILAGQNTPNTLHVINEVEGFAIYPNPVRDLLYIKTDYKGKRELYNSVGQLLFFTGNNEINVSRYSRGIYYIKIGNMVRKVIIE
jgi:hypothetical protein